ncbi:MAG: peptidylprolyl isomerase [Rickettsiales bacterium]|nr:MAG: peptidylprolyl isomerase [Rickettsiales bacterium]
MKIFFAFLLFVNVVYATNFKIVAKINNETITQYDYDIFAKKVKANTKAEILDLLIENTLKQQMVAQENIRFNEEEFKNSGVKTKDEYMWLKFVDKAIRPRVFLTRAEVDDNLENYGKNYVSRFNISQIMLKDDDKAQQSINKIYDEIKQKNETFEYMAKKFSLVNPEKNGLIGWVNESEMHPEIYKQIQNLQKGNFTRPFKSQGYHLIVKLNDREDIKKANNENSNKIQNYIYNKKILLEIQKYYDAFYNNSLIEKY